MFNCYYYYIYSISKWLVCNSDDVLVGQKLSTLVGGIPVEETTVKKFVSSDEENHHRTDLKTMKHITVNRAASVTFAANKREGEELIAAREYILKL